MTDPATNRLDTMLRQMVEAGASDLHLTAGHRPRMRIDGDMTEVESGQSLAEDEVFQLLDPVLLERNRQQFREHNDTDFAYAIEGVARFRVNLFRQRLGVGAVFRQIPDRILGIEELGLPEVVLRLCEQPKGLVLVTGPTGSGKSTTLAAMIDHINRTRSDHVITLEDPIEFVHRSQKCLVNQREIGVHTDSFAAALRAALREDPDIVLVGELRDLETVALAIESANTGHLVFGTLHTATAVSTVDRIIDMFPSHQQNQIRSGLSESLKAVFAQTLLKKIGGGRVAALEIMVVNHAIANLVREGKTAQIGSTMQTAKADGNQMLNEVLADLVRQKIVEPEEALARAVDKKELSMKIGAGARAAPNANWTPPPRR